jgi:sortase A
LAFVGRIEIPEVGISAMIGEGAAPGVLRVAVGHVPGTALPWEPGNVGLVAHRDTFFRRLGKIKIGDAIRITVPGSEFTYRVNFTEIVDPREIWVLQPATGDTLTLVTCYPFHFIGAAPKRFVVRARPVGQEHLRSPQ